MLNRIWRFLRDVATVCVESWQWCIENGFLATLAMAWWGIMVIVRLLWAVRGVLVAVIPGALLIALGMSCVAAPLTTAVLASGVALPPPGGMLWP